MSYHLDSHDAGYQPVGAQENVRSAGLGQEYLVPGLGVEQSHKVVGTPDLHSPDPGGQEFLHHMPGNSRQCNVDHEQSPVHGELFGHCSLFLRRSGLELLGELVHLDLDLVGLLSQLGRAYT